MRRVAVALLVLFWVTPALAGDWQPNPDLRYELTAPAESPAAPTPVEDRWVASLVAGLKRGGAKPNVVYRFARSSAELRANGEIGSQPVFVSRENPDLLLIVDYSGARPFAKFVVDLGKQRVSAYAHGTSLFIPPSRRFCVIVLDRAWGVGGIPVAGGVGANPSFEGRTVSWY